MTSLKARYSAETLYYPLKYYLLSIRLACHASELSLKKNTSTSIYIAVPLIAMPFQVLGYCLVRRQALYPIKNDTDLRRSTLVLNEVP